MSEFAYGLPEELQQQFSLDIQKEKCPQPELKRLNIKYFLSGQEIGYATLIENKSDYSLTWIRFYPHKQEKTTKRAKIGTLSYISTIIALAKTREYDGWQVGHGDFNEEEMKPFLISLGEDGSIIPIRTCVENLIKYGESRGFKFENPFDEIIAKK